MTDFKKSVADHKMTVENDNGIHRSLYFGKPKSGSCHFRINTWPGHLCISGDMGTFVFSRLPDMFEFFRGDRANLHYWAEKVEAKSIFGGGIMKYEPDTLKQHLIDCLGDREDAAEIMSQVSEYLTNDYSDSEAIRRIYECDGMSDFVCDLSESCYKDYTYQYKWCCEAIVWAIGVYDTEKKTEEMCQNCDNHRWVCENHPDLPWDGVSSSADACGCGAGMPCPECNPCGGRDDPPADPPGMKTIWDAEHGYRH